MKHLVIVRTTGSICDYRTYNSQEIGLARELIKKGYKVTVVTAGKSEERITIDSVDVCILKFFGLNQAISLFKRLSYILVTLKPDIVQIHDVGNFMTFQTLKLTEKMHVKTVLIQGSYDMTRKPFQRCLEYLFNRVFGTHILRNVDGIGCKTPSAATFLNSICRCSTCYTPVGLDASRFGENRQKEFKNNTERLLGKRVLLYVGSLESRRNPLFLIEILIRLSSAYVLVIVGGGPMEDAIRKEIRQKKLEERCLLLGKLSQSELPALYSQSDLFLLASDYEIYGMVLLEAFYFGLPVISTSTAGALSIVEDGINGYLLSWLSSAKWAETIEKYFADPEKAQQMKAAAAFHAKEYFLWEKTVSHFITLYEKH